MKLSMIVPCYNGVRFIPYFLKDLSNLTLPKDVVVELVCIDNGSSDESMQTFEKYRREFRIPFSVRLLSYTEKQGSYPARNYGVEQTDGDVLVFTDIDCRLPSDYIEKLCILVSGIQSGFIIAGNVELFLGEDPNLFEYYDYVFGFNMKSYVSQKTGVTANAVIDRNSFELAGGFDMVESGGDRMFYKKALRLPGIQYEFHPQLNVKHPCRNSYREITKKAKRVGRGLAYYANRRSFSYRMKYVLKNGVGAFLQANQFRVVSRSRAVRKELSLLKNLQLIVLIFWMGFYSRIYIVGQVIKG